MTSKDKKEMILQMAENNEIDQSLMDLMQQNIEVRGDCCEWSHL